MDKGASVQMHKHMGELKDAHLAERLRLCIDIELPTIKEHMGSNIEDRKTIL